MTGKMTFQEIATKLAELQTTITSKKEQMAALGTQLEVVSQETQVLEKQKAELEKQKEELEAVEKAEKAKQEAECKRLEAEQEKLTKELDAHRFTILSNYPVFNEVQQSLLRGNFGAIDGAGMSTIHSKFAETVAKCSDLKKLQTATALVTSWLQKKK